MWKCPSCAELIDDDFEVCWNCGTRTDGTRDTSFVRDPDAPYAADPPEESTSQLTEDGIVSGSSPARDGFAYSSFADFALIIGQGFALLGCIVAMTYALFCMEANNWIGVVLLAPMSFFLSLANFVVFARVGRL